MNKYIRILAVSLALSIGTVGAVSLSPAVAGASTTAFSARTGGLNIDGFCYAKYKVFNMGGGRAVLENPRDGKSWRCSVGIKRFDIDMNAACRWQYRGSAKANLRSRSNPYSWYCSY